MTFTQVQTSRGSFAVRLHGEVGEMVVCVHGFPDDASTFDNLASDLVRAGYQVAALNLRGYFPSPLDGSLALDDLVADLLALIDVLSPHAPVCLVGHDYGAQLAYPALASAPRRFRRAILLAGAHPAFVQQNARRSPRQIWRSRYIVLFQLKGYAERRVNRHDFAYIETLWRRWAPGFTIAAEHRAHVKQTLRMSMPGPIAMYRAGSFAVLRHEIPVPTLYITGADDGCALPFLADGQNELFTGDYTAETWDHTGHFPHLEHPERTATTVTRWLQSNCTPGPLG